MSPCHNRMSSLDSTNSDESSIPTPHYPLYGSVSSLISGHTESNMRNHYGSISSIASSTSRISDEVSLIFTQKPNFCPKSNFDKIGLLDNFSREIKVVEKKVQNDFFTQIFFDNFFFVKSKLLTTF